MELSKNVDHLLGEGLLIHPCFGVLRWGSDAVLQVERAKSRVLGLGSLEFSRLKDLKTEWRERDVGSRSCDQTEQRVHDMESEREESGCGDKSAD